MTNTLELPGEIMTKTDELREILEIKVSETANELYRIATSRVEIIDKVKFYILLDGFVKYYTYFSFSRLLSTSFLLDICLGLTKETEYNGIIQSGKNGQRSIAAFKQLMKDIKFLDFDSEKRQSPSGTIYTFSQEFKAIVKPGQEEVEPVEPVTEVEPVEPVELDDKENWDMSEIFK